MRILDTLFVNRALAVPYILFLHYFIVLQFSLLKMLLAGVPGVTRGKKIWNKNFSFFLAYLQGTHGFPK